MACVALPPFRRAANASPRLKDVSPGVATKTRSRLDATRFRARVDAALADAHARKVFWGILVADRDTGEVLYDLNSDHFFMPASNAKVITTAFALANLGAGYQFHTTLETSGPLGDDGRLAGDLVFVGRGDPDISNRKFPYELKTERDGPAEKILAEMVDEAIAKGLKEIDGDLVADDSYLPYDPYPAGWTIGDMFFEFGAPIGAIAFNDNSISIQVLPGVREGDPAILTVQPSAALDGFDSQITTSAPGGNPYFAVVRQPGPNFLMLRGTIPSDMRRPISNSR